MKYIPTITNKDLVHDMLTVQVVFRSEDDSRIVNDAFSTKSGQDPNWLQNAIAKKAEELSGLDDLFESIVLEEVVIASKKTDDPEDVLKEERKKEFEELSKWSLALRQGIIKEDFPELVALRDKVNSNLEHYLNLN